MELVFCMQCGQKIPSSAQACPHCGAQQTQVAASTSVPPQPASLPASALPEGVKGWSWGAFWLSWIWAIFNKTWIGLLALIPLVNLIMMVILGLKGREWAWINKAWPSVEHFNHVQKKWSLAGWIIMVVAFLSGIAIGVVEDRMKHHSNGEFDTNWSLDEDANKNSPASSSPARADTSPPQAMSPYPMPRHQNSSEYKEAYACAMESFKDGYENGPIAYCVGNSRDPSAIEEEAYKNAERDFSMEPEHTESSLAPAPPAEAPETGDTPSAPKVRSDADQFLSEVAKQADAEYQQRWDAIKANPQGFVENCTKENADMAIQLGGSDPVEARKAAASDCVRDLADLDFCMKKPGASAHSCYDNVFFRGD
jgi:hypothetical protein